jgi:cyclophilin family peptidyl-prolyl cis-trans isomerase
MPRLPFLSLALLTLACTTDPNQDESASETDGESSDEIGTDETTEDTADTETADTDESTGTETADTDETTDTGGPYGHGNLHPDCMGDNPQVVIVTNLGEMTLQLDAVRAPVTVANFLGYVSSGFYEGTIIHRVIDNFVLQGGGYEPGIVEKPTEPAIPLEIHPELRHDDGAIGMARTQDPNSATSQWYICDGAQNGLDDQYAVFGVLIDGFEVRDMISSVAVHDVGQFTDVPVEDIVIEQAYCVMQ